jgi:copper chaperone
MTTTTTITVQQIHCEGCENTIRTALGAVEGIRRVNPDAKTDTVAVAYDEKVVNEDTIRRHLADIGYQPTP